MAYKSDFPIFSAHPELIYLDSAATTQKPESVLQPMNDYYRTSNANVGRGIYALGSKSGELYQQARKKVSEFVGCNKGEVLFTGSATDGINKVASAYLAPRLQVGDTVIVTNIEHHANLVPWQQLCQRVNADFRLIELSEIRKALNEKPAMLCVSAMSNVTGASVDIGAICKEARLCDVPVLVDASQMVAHRPVNFDEWGCDFMAFSAHKMYGPMGIGVLCAKQPALGEMLPLSYGGGAVLEVSEESTEFRTGWQRHEPGTPNVAGAVGLAAAIDYLEQIGWQEIMAHDKHLLSELKRQLNAIEGVQLIETSTEPGPILSFVVDGIHPHDVATFLADRDIAIRAGNHCAQPLIDSLQTGPTCRVSFGMYSDENDIEQLVNALKAMQKFFLS